MSHEDRYDGNPMLRLMDSYVLDAIGVLDGKTAESLSEQAPMLADALDTEQGTWQEVVERSMGMPADSKETLAAAWQQYQVEYAQHDEPADPIAFAHMMVDRATAA